MVAVLVLGAALVVPALASGSGGAAASSAIPTIYIRGATLNSLRFVGPKKMAEGEELQIVNQSNVRKVGPQTFTLVEASEIPKTKKQRESCMKRGQICKAIIGWHGIHGTKAKTNPVEAGLEGWGTEGTKRSKGDSWYTGTQPNASFSQVMSAGAGFVPITLTFMSAFDPALHGKITVMPQR
ncbi:MAG: hypothetical protein WB507_09020 [Solirubrobacterales bacterium]